jgi:hypothetical protein
VCDSILGFVNDKPEFISALLELMTLLWAMCDTAARYMDRSTRDMCSKEEDLSYFD